MDAAQNLPPSTRSSVRWLLGFAIATWIASLVSAAIFAIFWRTTRVSPHGAWAVVTAGTILLSGALTLVIGMVRMIRGPRRLFAGAILLLGTTPIVWTASFFLTLWWQFQVREPMTMIDAMRITGYFASSAADAEARWRYPRRTTGAHVVLLDNGNIPQPEKLVAQMDKHIEEMAERLHREPPAVKAYWVRGSVLGQHGCAIPGWAICDDDRESSELRALDRHEMAHILITLLGDADQFPPGLLNEGWAEAQSQDRANLIKTLANFDETYSLQELIEPQWYGRSYGPVYNHGGPFVIYLLEHYGSERFLALYYGARPATFSADCERFLGDSWPKVEKEFWDWLRQEAEKIASAEDKSPRITADDVTLGSGVKATDWRAIVEGYRAAWQRRPAWPQAYAFRRTHSFVRPAPDGNMKEVVACARDGELGWQVNTQEPGGTSCLISTPEQKTSISVSEKGTVTRNDYSKNFIFRSSFAEINRYVDRADLGHVLPLDPKRNYSWKVRVDAIRPPQSTEQSIWEIDFTDQPPEGVETKCHVRCDAAADWMMLSETESNSEMKNENTYELRKMFGRIATARDEARTTAKDFESSVNITVVELNSVEAEAVRTQAEEIARRYPIHIWYETLVRPMALAIAWPVAGLLLLAISLSHSSSHVIPN